MWNNSSSAIPEPIISAMSVAIIANSATTHSMNPTRLLVRSRVNCAKSFPVTIPNRADIACKSMAIKLEIKMTDSNVYLN